MHTNLMIGIALEGQEKPGSLFFSSFDYIPTMELLDHMASLHITF